METSICTAVQNNPLIQSHKVEIKGLREENIRLNRKVQQLSSETGQDEKTIKQNRSQKSGLFNDNQGNN